MNKTEFVKAIADEAGLTIKDSGTFVDAFVEVTKRSLSKGDSITLVGFGSFEVVERKARPGRDFKTGEMINVPASKTVKFKAGKTLKDSVK